MVPRSGPGNLRIEQFLFINRQDQPAGKVGRCDDGNFSA